MELDAEANSQLAADAEETLCEISNIASSAAIAASEGSIRPDHIHDAEAMQSERTKQEIWRLNQSKREACHLLQKAPAVARIDVIDDCGKQEVIFISRVSATAKSKSKNIKFASLNSPIGALCEQEPGDELDLPNGRVLKLIARHRLHPQARSNEWDSIDTIIENQDIGAITVASLRALLEQAKEDESDILAEMQAAEKKSQNIRLGIQRQVIQNMNLRGRSIFDKAQGEIYRLPLSTRLFLTGPPGTGKTTTLIRRLGQKLDTENGLDEGEKQQVRAQNLASGREHKTNWQMFTPTDLLKQYLKEAFSLEEIPAPEGCVSTWEDYRRKLARDFFGLLKTSSGGGAFILKEKDILKNNAVTNSAEWFYDFDNWSTTSFVKELRNAATFASGSYADELRTLGQKVLRILDDTRNKALKNIINALSVHSAAGDEIATRLKRETDKKIRNALNLQLNRDKQFIDKFAEFLQALEKSGDEEPDLQMDDDLEAIDAPRGHVSPRQAAITRYTNVARSQARAMASRRSIKHASNTGKIVEWLGDRTLDATDLEEVGEKLLMQSNARRLANPLRDYLNGLPRLYRQFRKLRQDQGNWYSGEAITANEICGLELDILVLARLRLSSQLLRDANVRGDTDSRQWSSLKPALECYRNQVFIDEATDFSPVQLASMASLSHPEIRSVFACGDYNQRLTTWGASGDNDLKFVFPEGFVKRELAVGYRQSQHLIEFARAIVGVVGGISPNIKLPPHMSVEGLKPALKENTISDNDLFNWLGSQIQNIESSLGQLPSIAVFVDAEEKVNPFAEQLGLQLEKYNIRVEGCVEGRIVGNQSNVRVFDIQHIKGLEFEAVFFVSVDRLASRLPDLFDKYLYVGATRAATYLAVTCEEKLPEVMHKMRNMFVDSWAAPV